MSKLLVVVDKLGGAMSWEIENLKSFVDGEFLSFWEMTKENYEDWKEDVEFPEIVHDCMRNGKKVIEVQQIGYGTSEYYSEDDFDGEELALSALLREYSKVFVIESAAEAAEIANTYRGNGWGSVFNEILYSYLFRDVLEELADGKMAVKSAE